MADSIFDLIDRGPVLFDGAMGTMLYEKGIYINRCFDELNLSIPSLVSEIHEAYIDAGAQVIETNTFGANRIKLMPYGFDDKVTEINREGVRIARKAAKGMALVAGSIGPLGMRIEPLGPLSIPEAEDVMKEQADALVDGGIDLFIAETFSDLNELRVLLKILKENYNLPVIAQMTLEDDGNSLYGTTPEIFTKRLEEWGADIIGINCSVGPHIMLETLKKMVRVTNRPLSVQPNAGRPRNVEGRTIYLTSPEYMAEYAKRFIRAGASIVGGCCGTTPKHIRAMKGAIKMISPVFKAVSGGMERIVEIDQKVEPIPYEKKSRLSESLSKGRFVVSVEILPPRSFNMDKVITWARELKEAGVDTVNIPDGPRATVRMSSMATAFRIEREAEMETILHYTCRDRNMLGIQSDLLGAYSMGLRNILAITGDPPKLGTYPDATAVYDIDSIGLTKLIYLLNHGTDIGGTPIGDVTGFLIGVGVNPTAISFDEEMRRFFLKIEAGAEFAITQPVFDLRQMEMFLNEVRRRGVKIPIIMGIWPLSSIRNAEFLRNEVPGVSIPDEIMERLKRHDSAQREEGLRIALEIIESMRRDVQGIQVSILGHKSDIIESILKAAKLDKA